VGLGSGLGVGVEDEGSSCQRFRQGGSKQEAITVGTGFFPGWVEVGKREVGRAGVGRAGVGRAGVGREGVGRAGGDQRLEKGPRPRRTAKPHGVISLLTALDACACASSGASSWGVGVWCVGAEGLRLGVEGGK